MGGFALGIVIILWVVQLILKISAGNPVERPMREETTDEFLDRRLKERAKEAGH